jgi:hypothetical protein
LELLLKGNLAAVSGVGDRLNILHRFEILKRGLPASCFLAFSRWMKN